jgi:hypothetical protein
VCLAELQPRGCRVIEIKLAWGLGCLPDALDDHLGLPDGDRMAAPGLGHGDARPRALCQARLSMSSATNSLRCAKVVDDK